MVLLALCATGLVVLALLVELLLPALRRAAARRRHSSSLDARVAGYDPGRELRAETRAAELLKSCIGDEEWLMYRELGFIRVYGQSRSGSPVADGSPEYAYLIYPHEPVVSYLCENDSPLAEYCVQFPDETRPFGSDRLPASDDVLAKWMALTSDETRLLDSANMHLPGRQTELSRIKRDRRWVHRATEPKSER